MKYLIVSSHVGGRGLYISGVVCDDGSKYILYVSLLIFFYREEGWGVSLIRTSKLVRSWGPWGEAFFLGGGGLKNKTKP